MKFLGIPKKGFNCRRLLFTLEYYYSKQNYKKVHETLEYIKHLKENKGKCSYFPTEAKEKILEIYYRNIRMRWIVRKMFFLKKLRTIKKIEPKNLITLNLNPITKLNEEDKFLPS